MTLDNLAHGCLFFSNAEFLVPFIIVGYLWLGRNIFFHATCLLLISILLNIALKHSFQIPLAPELGKEGYAFPSGHMQATAAFYGWLWFKSNRVVVRIVLSAVLVGIGFGLVQLGYHNYQDVAGALFFAALLGVVYYQVITRWQHKKNGQLV